MENKIILDLCGGTGSWSAPYRKAGYDVRLVTLPQNDVRTYEPPENVYGILAAPPCTEFSIAKCNPKSALRDLKGGTEIMKACLEIIWKCSKVKTNGDKKVSLKFWALENPYGLMRYFLGKPALEFSPYEFGDAYKKRTHLWGHFNTPIKTPVIPNIKKFDVLLTKEIHPEYYGKLTRTERRAITPQGFANAFFQVNL